MTQRRVVITGIGAVTPLGLNLQDTWAALIAGTSGIGEITRFDASILPTQFAAEVKGFDPTKAVEHKEVRRTDLYQQFGMSAAREALGQSGLVVTPDNMGMIGCVVGTSVGGHQTLVGEHDVLHSKGVRRMNPFTIPMVMNNGLTGLIAVTFGLGGPTFCPTSACSTGNDSIGLATNMIRWGMADVMLAGGADSTVAAVGMAGFAQAGALSIRKERTPRPFDKDRDGVLVGEGAAVFVLEALDHALARGAHILAEVAGYGITNDAHHMVAPSPGGVGAARAIGNALKDAGLAPGDVHYINAHGTATPRNDVEETNAIKRAFGEHAHGVPISSTKSMTGHCMGAAGAIEAAFCVKAILNGVLPPTINHDNPDPECDLDYVPLVARRKRVDVAMNNSFGFGGHNSVLIFKRHA